MASQKKPCEHEFTFFNYSIIQKNCVVARGNLLQLIAAARAKYGSLL
jgi:hypothetical protein